MRTHRLTAAIASLSLLLTPAAAMALPADGTESRAVAPATGPSGDTKFDLAVATIPAAKAGDTKFDSPGASRAPEYDPPATIQVIRPERTIVRDVNEELPLILAGVGLLVAVAGVGFALLRTRRIVVGR